MTKGIFFSLALIFASCSITIAQNCDNLYWGTKTIYQPQQKKYTPPPPGFKPVFINYVGRHGARHLTKDVNTSLAFAFLQKADSSKALTADGMKLKAMVEKLQKIEAPVLKFLSIRGAAEQQGIGHRMLLNNSNVFKDGKYCINVSITKEERTKQSSEAFLKGLGYDATKSACSANVKIDNDALRFFSIAPAYADFEDHGEWKQPMERLEKAIKPTSFDAVFLSRFFEKGFLTKLSADDQDTFIDDVFGFESIINSIGQEIINAGYTKDQLNFRSVFTCDQLRILDELSSAGDFLMKGPAMNTNGIQVRDAVPLLVSFINTTDSYMAQKNVSAELRFAHAETIAPFAALLGFNGAATPVKNVLQINKVWKASAVVPLSANIQWILLRDSNSHYLVKFLLNEKEVGIKGLQTKIFPYYKWTSVRTFYLTKLNNLHVGLHDDIHGYLLNLK